MRSRKFPKTLRDVYDGYVIVDPGCVLCCGADGQPVYSRQKDARAKINSAMFRDGFRVSRVAIVPAEMWEDRR